MKLIQKTPKIITLDEMPINSVGVIMKWGDSPKYAGEIVKKVHIYANSVGNVLVSLQEGSNRSWSGLHNMSGSDYQIKLLEKGDILEIE